MINDESSSPASPFSETAVDDIAQAADVAVEVGAAEIDALGDLKGAVVDSFDDVVAAARQLIRDKPLAALGIAAGAAYLLARIRR